jgi:hypothetical protein
LIIYLFSLQLIPLLFIYSMYTCEKFLYVRFLHHSVIEQWKHWFFNYWFFFHFKVYFFNYCNKLSIIHSFLLRIIFDHAEGVLYTWIKKNICTVSSSVIDSSLIRGMSYFEGDNLLVFYYLNTSNIWPDNRGGLWWEGSYKRGTTVLL